MLFKNFPFIALEVKVGILWGKRKERFFLAAEYADFADLTLMFQIFSKKNQRIRRLKKV
jgi:hypothetical protein